MISTNDTTILSMLSRYPDMPMDEAEEYISKIQNEENVAICHAVIGKISPDELPTSSLRVYREFVQWSKDRTRRFKNEQLTARQRGQMTSEAIRLTQLHEKGLVTDEFMLMYGIQGDLPERNAYLDMTNYEKLDVFESRIENRLGANWRHRFRRLPKFLEEIKRAHNWKLEGF